MASKLGLKNVTFIPISAKFGDNVVDKSQHTPWYTGGTLMNVLETTPIDHKLARGAARLPVQWVIRPMNDEFHDFRSYAGRMAGGELKKGEQIKVLPSGLTSTIAAIYECDKELEKATTPASVSITLADNIDISRGDMIVAVGEQEPIVSQDVTMMICWLNEKPMQLNGKYIIRTNVKETRAIVKNIDYKLNIETLDKIEGVNSLVVNDIANITIRTAQPLVFDPYTTNRTTGSLIFIDEATNETVGAAMIIK